MNNIENNMNDKQNDTNKTHQFGRGYFDGEAYTGLGYQDFPVHFKTVELIKERDPKSVIDIGGARGYIAKKLSDQNIPATCMDISEHCYHTRATDNFILHDITKTPYPIKDKQFDLSISVSVLEHIPEDRINDVIKEIARISNRGYHGITFEITKEDVDKTHINIHPKEWWLSKFKENAPDYHIEIVDKEEMEAPPIHVPGPDNLVKLNIGSYINQYHYGWQNIDILDLTQFAQHNGYTFRQLDVTKGLSYNENSVDIIVSSHFIEHITREEGLSFLKECYRVMKPGSIIRLTVPDTELLINKYATNDISQYKHINVGVEKSTDNADSLFELLLSGHKTIYDYDSLSKLLSKAGFVDITRKDFNKSSSKTIESQTIDMYPSLSLYIEAKKPQISFSDIINPDKIIVVGKKESGMTGLSTGKTARKTDRNKLRIGLISTPFFTVPPKGYSGLEQVVWDLAEALDELGHEVTLFAPKGSQPTKHGKLVETGESLNTTNVDWLGEERKNYEIYKQYITPDKFDVTHGHTWFGFEYLLKQQYPNLRVTHSHHGGIVWNTLPPVTKPNLIAISDFMRNYTIQYFNQKGQNADCRFVYNGINLDRYPYQSNKTDNLLFVGRFSTFKQPDVAIAIAEKLNMNIDLVGGTFVDDPNYIKLIESKCDNDKIRIYKDVAHDFKIKKMQNAKALIFPSNMGEPYGLVAAEAMACGTPVIALNDGAIAEVVIHGRTGFVCNSTKEMLDAVKNIHTIKPEACRERAEQLSRQVMAKEYLKLYNDVLDNKEW